MPRFVILRHEPGESGDRPLHWDLMLESGAALRTWALEAEPRAASSFSATALPDHRLAYLDYEGPISHGRGQVTQYDAGLFRWLAEDGPRIRVELCGSRLSCELTLEQGSEESSTWSARFAAV